MSKPKIQNVFKVVNGAKKPTILISGYVGKYDKVNAEDFRKAIADMETQSVEDCELLINSGGGSTIEGLTIGDFMTNSTIKFHGTVVGMAASMGAGILMFCDTRSAYKNARIMTHKVKAGAYGESTALRSMADLADQEEEKIMNQFVTATGQSEKTVKTWFVSGVDKWFNATEAKKFNLIQKEIEPPKKTNAIDNSITNELELVNAYEPTMQELVTNQSETNLETDMNKAEIIALFATMGNTHNLTNNSTDEQLSNELKKVFEIAATATEHKTKLDNYLKSSAETVIAQAVKEGKIPPAEKGQWVEDYIENPNMVTKAVSRMSGKPNPNNGLETPDLNNGDDAEQHELFKGREKWTFAEWQDKAPEDLQKLEDAAPEEFNELFKNQYK